MTRPAIQFYHLITTPLERALPKLMEKACAQGMRVVVRGSAAQVGRLDEALWTYDPDSFLPHGASYDPAHERQPIYLAEQDENPNGASLLVIADGREFSGMEAGVERVFDMFDGANEDEVVAARARWKTYKDKGFALTYIRQKENGGWEKVMEA